MNILSVNGFKFNTPFRSNEAQSSATTTPKFGLVMSKPLSKDSVSFKATQPVADVIEHQIKKDEARMKRLAKTYLAILESIANELKEFGVSFNKAYCEKSPVKSSKSQISKIKRNLTFDIPDKIRATLFVKDIYNLSILNDMILPKLEEVGFIVKEIPGDLEKLIMKGYVPDIKEVSGKEVMVPDLDIRLANVDDKVSQLDPKYQFSIGKPQKSGYEDIQLRLVRDFDDKVHPVQHELIILMGDNYACAKHLESDMVYGVLRRFDELNIIKKGNENIETCKIARQCIALLKQVFGSEVSKKLFNNAKKMDLEGSQDLEKIHFSDEDVKLIEICIDELKRSVNSYYRTARASKRIGAATKERIMKEAKNDKDALFAICEDLKFTVEFFNEKDYLERDLMSLISKPSQ